MGVFSPRHTVLLAIIGKLSLVDASLEDANNVLMRRAKKPVNVLSDAGGHSFGKSSRQMSRAVGTIGHHDNFDNAQILFAESDRSQRTWQHLRTWQQAFKEDPSLFTGCRSIFLDVGSNRGTHVRKLFEPWKYPFCTYLDVFDKGFGVEETRTRPFNQTGICTFGFEANPRWSSTLQELEKAYTAQGWRVKWFAPEAVSDTKGSLNLWKNDDGANSDWGFSMRKYNPNATEVSVPAIDFSAFIEEMHKNAPSGYRLMKMDIESAEFTVLPKFLTKQLLCKDVLDTITIEWHDRSLQTNASKEQAKQLETAVNSSSKCKSGPSTTVLPFDDESYLDDGMSLPGSEHGLEWLRAWLHSR